MFSFLILPMQRVTRLPLLLDVSSHTVALLGTSEEVTLLFPLFSEPETDSAWTSSPLELGPECSCIQEKHLDNSQGRGGILCRARS